MMMYKYLIVLSLCFVNCVWAGQPIFVGIAGGTGSGKTTLAKQIQEAFGDDVVLIEQDSYYKDLSGLHPSERHKANFDHPNALEFTLLQVHLEDLKNNKPIEKPVYDFVTHSRIERTVPVEPKKVVIVEGILLFAVPELRDLFDLKVYVDNEDDIRLLRRIQRDIEERGRDFDSVRDQYLATVKPMHDAFVAPSKWYADVIIPSVSDNTVAISLILSKLREEVYGSN
jgi:uridine kinase